MPPPKTQITPRIKVRRMLGIRKAHLDQVVILANVSLY